MGILNRLLLLPSALLLMAVAALAAAAALRLLPESIWLNEMRFALVQPEFPAVCAVVFLIGLKLFFAVFSGRSETGRAHGEIMVVDTPAGAVQVELSAVRGIIERIALGISGVRDVSARVCVPPQKNENAAPLQVDLELGLSAQAHLSPVSEQMTERIRQELLNLHGIEGIPISIRVTDVSSAAPQSKKRVM